MKKTYKKKLGSLLLCSAALLSVPNPVLAADEETISYDIADEEVVAVRDEVSTPEPEPAEPVREDTYAGGQISRKDSLGILGERDFLDTPFNVTGYTSELIENQQASSISDVVVNDSSVSIQSGSSATNLWYIRGLSLASQDIQYNGMYGIAPQYHASVDSVERVEVLKGPSALLNGMSPNGAVGGSINLIPKRAKDEPITKFTLSYGDGHQFGQHLDIGRRYADGKYGVRVNAVHQKGSTSFDREEAQLDAVSVALDMKTDRARASLDLGYINRRIDNPTTGLKFSNSLLETMHNPPKAPDNFNFASPGTYIDTTEKYGALHGEYDFNENWTGYASLGMRYTTQDYVYNAYRLTPTGITINNYIYPKSANADTQELGIRGKFNTGNIKHQFTLAGTRVHSTSYNTSRLISSYTVPGLDNMFSPTWQDIGDTSYSSLVRRNETTLSGIAITDVLSTPNDEWQLILGGRLQNVKVDSYRANGQKSASYDESAFSPAVGLVHKLNNTTSIYANYIQGLQQGGTVNDAEAPNNGEVFAPYKTEQYEIGAKFDSGKFATTISAFSIDVPSLIQDPVTKIYDDDGSVRSKGIELNFFGEPTEGTRLLGGLTFLDAKYNKTANGTYDGNRIDGTSRFTGVLGVEHDLKSVEGLTLTTRAVYNGSAYIDPANTFKVSPWIRWDLGARYKFNMDKTPMTLRLDVYNVFNKNYWEARSYGVNLGRSRTVMLSLTADL